METIIHNVIQLLEISKNLERGKYYSLEQISSRAGIKPDVCKLLLKKIIDMKLGKGSFEKMSNDEYYIQE